MSRFYQILQVKPGEERTTLLVIGLMLVTAVGAALGGNATEALFFDRFGVEQLPTMYILLGLFTLATSLSITALMGRIPRRRFYSSLPIVLGFILVGEWLVISFNIRWTFAVMWLGMNVINSLVGLLIWGLAGAACDTRQAKRLFPLFSAGFILGTVLGGLITPPLANRLHAENLLLLWAVAMFASFLISRSLVRHITVVPNPSHAQRTKVIDEMQRGYRFVRGSPIMKWISLSAILFSVCFFSLALPFSRGATAQYTDADRLAGFLGLFQSLSTGAALLISLLLANRLFARFGILPMLLVFPLIYLTGFGVLAVAAPFALLVMVRFAQMSYMDGVAGTAWQALYNVVPPDQRDQVRAFVEGVPGQAGVILAGLLLLLGDYFFQPWQLYLIGFAAAAFLTYFIWRAGRDYSRALVDALHAGQPQVFFNEEQPFGNLHMDAEAAAVAIRGLKDADAGVRRVSAEITGHLEVRNAAPALVEALSDEDVEVRVASLKGLTHAGTSSALLEISACLSDPEPDVRTAAIDSLWHLASSSRAIVAHVEPLLEDSDPMVRIQATLVLLRTNGHERAREILRSMAIDPDPLVRARALSGLGSGGDESAFDLVASAMEDDQPVVRKAAAEALVDLNPQNALEILILHLDEAHSSVRRAMAESFGRIGEPALKSVLEALSDPDREDGALIALEHLPAQKVVDEIRSYAKSTQESSLRYHRLAYGIRQNNGPAVVDERVQLLVDALNASSLHCGLNALRAVGLMTAREAVEATLENLGSRDATQRANALETLESIGEQDIVRPLLALWESNETSSMELPEGWLLKLLDDPSSWLRACAVFVAGKNGDGDLRDKLGIMSRSDPDELVRSLAGVELYGEIAMDTLTTLSMMERILFLRRVPLFASLPPADLKQVAAIAGEALFSDGQVIGRQGDIGTEMYIIVSGEVRVQVDSEGQKTARELALRRSGDYVGEMSIIVQEPRIATLISIGAVRALYISQKQFEGILRERPEIGLSMMRILCQRLKEASLPSAD